MSSIAGLLLLGALGAMFIGSIQGEDFSFTLIFCFAISCVGQVMRNLSTLRKLNIAEKAKLLFFHALFFIPLLSIVWAIGQIL